MFFGKISCMIASRIPWSTVNPHFSGKAHYSGKPLFFQTKLKKRDAEEGIVWDAASARATVMELDMAPKVRIIVGPTRYCHELHLPSGKGTNWGPDLDLCGICQL
jgi:hypothetical protein